MAAHGPAFSTPPDCHHVQQLIVHQVDDAESRSMYLSRLRNKDFIRGSYDWLEGGSVGVDLPAICEVIALIGVAFCEFDGFGVVVDIELNYDPPSRGSQCPKHNRHNTDHAPGVTQKLCVCVHMCNRFPPQKTIEAQIFMLRQFFP